MSLVRDEDKYAGEYKLDEKTKQVSGCPARAPCVLEIKKSVQTRGKTKAATRKHAEALTIEDIKKLMQWSERTCSNGQIEQVLSQETDEGGRSYFDRANSEKPLTVDEIQAVFNHGFMRGFMTSAFTLWTR